HGDRALPRRGRNRDPAALRRVLERIVNEVGQGLAQPDRVAVHLRRRGDIQLNHYVLLFRHLAVQVRGAARQGPQVHPLAPQRERPGLGGGHVEQHLEQVQDPVRLVDAVRQRRPCLGRVAAVRQGEFRRAAKAGQRRSQVVREVVEGLPEHPDVVRVLVEERVQLPGEEGELAASARGRDAGREVVLVEYAARGLGDLAQRPGRAPREERARRQREEQRDRPDAGEGGPQRREEDRAAVGAVGDLDQAAVRQDAGGYGKVPRGVARDADRVDLLRPPAPPGVRDE